MSKNTRDGLKKRHRFKGTIKVPVGMEKVLFLAAKDEEFKQKFLNDRQSAIEESGVKLRPSEEATLNVISNAALETMIANIVPENPRRRKFMGLVAAAAASLATGTTEVACDREKVNSLGISPDDDVDDDDDDDDNDTGTDTDTDTDSDTDTDTDTDTDADTDIDVDAGTDGGVWVGVTCDEDVDGF